VLFISVSFESKLRRLLSKNKNHYLLWLLQLLQLLVSNFM